MSWINYPNGNYNVLLNTLSGTKIRYTDDKEFIAQRPESIDVKITNFCEHNCAFCHENSNRKGQDALLEDVAEFASNLPPYTEIAVGGGNLMGDPSFTESCLSSFKTAKAICSITLRQDDFIHGQAAIKYWWNHHFVYGIGISLYDSNKNKLWELYHEYPTTVIHIVLGIVTPEQIEKLIEEKARVLILGYKRVRKGNMYYKANEAKIQENKQYLEKNLQRLMDACEVCSFDNLALKQLPLRALVDEETWQKHFMGNDGTATFYVDLVTMQFAESSSSTTRYLIEKNNPMWMFKKIQKEGKHEY